MLAVHKLRLAALLGTWCMLVARCAPPAEIDSDASPEPSLIVLSSDPHDGAADIPTDKVVKIYMSDHVSGESVRRSRFSLTSGNLSMWLMAHYDPVRGRLVVWPSSSMRKGATWVFEFVDGLEGLDGERVPSGVVTTFETGDEGGDNHPYDEYNYQEHVAPIFESRCSSCHSGGSPISGLSLASVDTVVDTAIYREADGWYGWSRIEPSKPGASYLLYKLIGDPRIGGDQMPRSFDPDVPTTPLAQEELEIISDWIAGGAVFFDHGDAAQ